ncbi:BLUF domain-containing protein [Oceanospirillum sediminis]|uniref:BLUF domain-containing protein n=1 Tax=Oceanospirillum sediminis TaxID=2760088 RepID=A0A839IVP0_9GAMM|nr:BLUF domain-containing protein [Oceanospirillum sediminis]MBB1489018.1 BLUF domain-containing protein [Oceanospirillum sediminis]
MMYLHQIIYVCTQSRPLDDDDLVELLADAMGRNAERQITGMLLYYQGAFLQVLEGEVHELHHLMHAIENDNRVRDIVKLSEKAVTHRDFPDWSMGFQVIRDGDDESSAFFRIFDQQGLLRLQDKASLAHHLLSRFIENARSDEAQ